MALITSIIKPELFGPAPLANRLLKHLGWNDAGENVRQEFIDSFANMLGDLVAEGILGEEPHSGAGGAG